MCLSFTYEYSIKRKSKNLEFVDSELIIKLIVVKVIKYATIYCMFFLCQLYIFI